MLRFGTDCTFYNNSFVYSYHVVDLGMPLRKRPVSSFCSCTSKSHPCNLYIHTLMHIILHNIIEVSKDEAVSYTNYTHME